MRYTVLALVAAVHVAAAQPAGNQRASALFEQGRDLAKRGDYAAACDVFAESFILDPAPGTALNLGDCHEHLGHFAEAWRRFAEAAARFESTHDDRAKFARERRDALAGRLGVVIVKLGDPNVQVEIAGRPVASSPEIRERVDPGTVEVHAGSMTRNAQVVAGGSVVIEFPAGISEPPAVPPATPPQSSTTTTTTTTTNTTTDSAVPQHNWQKLAAYGAGGAGVVVGAVALGLALDARSNYNSVEDSTHCTHSNGVVACDSHGVTSLNNAIHLANIGTGFAIASVVLIGGGAVLYFTAPHDGLVIVPTATASSAGMMVKGSF